MARVSTPTLLSVDQWAMIMGINLWQFNQIGKGLPKDPATQCKSAWFQHPFQADTLSREIVGRTIANAEELFWDKVHYWPAPKYTEELQLTIPKPRKNKLSSYYDVRGLWKSIALPDFKVQEVGTLTRTLIQADNLIVTSDSTGTGFVDTWTATVAVPAGTRADELVVFVSEDFRLGNDLDSTWEIRPVRISVSGTVATIISTLAIMVLPSAHETYAAVNLSKADPIFMGKVDLYLQFIDTTHTVASPQQGLAVWDVPGTCDPQCDVKTAPLCLSQVDKEAGSVALQVKPNDTPYYWGPDRAQINYSSGVPLKNRQMKLKYALIIAYLATSMFPTEKCGCERSSVIIAHWRGLPSDGNQRGRPLTFDEIDHPFGPSRGGRYAWEQIRIEAVDGDNY